MTEDQGQKVNICLQTNGVYWIKIGGAMLDSCYFYADLKDQKQTDTRKLLIFALQILHNKGKCSIFAIPFENETTFSFVRFTEGSLYFLGDVELADKNVDISFFTRESGTKIKKTITGDINDYHKLHEKISKIIKDLRIEDMQEGAVGAKKTRDTKTSVKNLPSDSQSSQDKQSTGSTSSSDRKTTVDRDQEQALGDSQTPQTARQILISRTFLHVKTESQQEMRGTKSDPSFNKVSSDTPYNPHGVSLENAVASQVVATGCSQGRG